MCKAFRAKAKAEREVKGDYTLQYVMLRYYVIELESLSPNTTIKIAVERNTNPYLPTRMFKRLYIYLGSLKKVLRFAKEEAINNAVTSGSASSQAEGGIDQDGLDVGVVQGDQLGQSSAGVGQFKVSQLLFRCKLGQVLVGNLAKVLVNEMLVLAHVLQVETQCYSHPLDRQREEYKLRE
nr:hypothetical protein [Tanacetum cinerariifolium]